MFADRYHARILKTPRQVRNTIAYVLNNWRHHGEDKLDDREGLGDRSVRERLSSFTGWKERDDKGYTYRAPPGYLGFVVWQPTLWLLREGWKRGGSSARTRCPAVASSRRASSDLPDALPAPDQQRRASRQQAHVAVNRDVAVDNRSGSANANRRAAVPTATWTAARIHSSTGWRARPHDSQRHHRLSAFGFPDPEQAILDGLKSTAAWT